MVDYTGRTLAELAEGINQTDSAIQRCQEILRGLGQPRIEGLQAVVEAIHNLLPKLEQDLTDLKKAYDALAKPPPNAFPNAAHDATATSVDRLLRHLVFDFR